MRPNSYCKVGPNVKVWSHTLRLSLVKIQLIFPLSVIV